MRIDVRLGGRCQWVLDAVYQTVEWPSQPLRFDSVVSARPLDKLNVTLSWNRSW